MWKGFEMDSGQQMEVQEFQFLSVVLLAEGDFTELIKIKHVVGLVFHVISLHQLLLTKRNVFNVP